MKNMNLSFSVDDKLKKLFLESGIPSEYHFLNPETSWSTEYSPYRKLVGGSKKKSEDIKKFFLAYLRSLPAILNGKGLKVNTSNEIKIVNNFILDGGPASGKSFWLAMIGQEAIKKGFSVKYVNWCDFLDRFFSFESIEENTGFYEDCLNVDVLLFDSVKDYEINKNKFLNVKIERLISQRKLDDHKLTVVAICSTENVPSFGYDWDRFIQSTFRINLPEANKLNEIKSKRT